MLSTTLTKLAFIKYNTKQLQNIHPFFLHTYGMYTNIDHIQGHKSSFNKFQKFVLRAYFSDCNEITLDINYNNKARKALIIWK